MRNAFAVSFASIATLRYVIIVLYMVVLVIELSIIDLNKMLHTCMTFFIGSLLYYRVNEIHSMNRNHKELYRNEYYRFYKW